MATTDYKDEVLVSVSAPEDEEKSKQGTASADNVGADTQADSQAASQNAGPTTNQTGSTGQAAGQAVGTATSQTTGEAQGNAADGNGGERPLPYSFLEELMKSTPPPPSEEDIAKLRRKQKRDRLLSSIGNGISALSNLFFTTKYAPNSYKPSQLSKANQDRYDRLIKEMQDERQNYMKNRLAAMKLDIDAGNKGALLTLKQNEDARKQKEAERKQREHEIKLELGKINIDNAIKRGEGLELENRLKALRAEALEKGMDYIVPKIEAQIEALRRKGTGGGKGNGGKGSTWYAKDEKGEVHSFTASSKANAHSIAGAKGWKLFVPTKKSKTTTTDKYGREKTTDTDSWEETDTGEPKKKKQNPMKGGAASSGTQQQGKKANPMSK